jgi:hypothetical protein
MATTIEALREAIEYAPPSGPVAEGLRGIWTQDGHFVCGPCVGRITARGCGHVLKTEVHVWADRGEPVGVCVTCSETRPLGAR